MRLVVFPQLLLFLPNLGMVFSAHLFARDYDPSRENHRRRLWRHTLHPSEEFGLGGTEVGSPYQRTCTVVIVTLCQYSYERDSKVAVASLEYGR